MTHLVTTFVDVESEDSDGAGEDAGADPDLSATLDEEPEPAGTKRDSWLADTLDAEEGPESARKRDKALREALSNTFSSETEKGSDDPSTSGETGGEMSARSSRPPERRRRFSESDFTSTTAQHDHDKVKAVCDAVADEWASDKPIGEKIENAIDLALYFYRIVMSGDTKITLGLIAIHGFQKDIRRQVRGLLEPDDDLAGVGQALRIISTLGRDKGWRWADDVTLALFNCENAGFAEKAKEIEETLPMLINRKKLAALRKMFS